MTKGLKICGVSDPETLNYILNHIHKPIMIGFITNYKKSKRFVKYEKLKDLSEGKEVKISNFEEEKFLSSIREKMYGNRS